MLTLVISDDFLSPIWTMLTENSTANYITFWLNEWLSLGGSVPNELCTDMSLALLIAGVRAFTSYCSLDEYINTLFGMNFEKENVGMPVPQFECFIRIDIAHLFKNVASSEAFANKKPKVRETYLRCVALLVKETDIENARKIITCILVMAYSQTEGILIYYTVIQN